MNRKGFIDEINPMFIALGLLGGILSFWMVGRVEGLGAFWKFASFVFTFLAVFFYLVITDG